MRYCFTSENNPMKNPEIAKKTADANRGRKVSSETRKKISEIQKGKHHSPKTEFKKGQKHKPMSEETKEKIRQAVIKQHLEGRARILKKGEYKPTEETKRKIKIARAKQVITQKHKDNIKAAHLSGGNKKFKNTGIELKIENELKIRCIKYEKQVPLCRIAVVDFYLPDYNIVIECDGCFWHGCQIHYPTRKQEVRGKDQYKTDVLLKNGFAVYRFWEHDINQSPSNCVDSIILIKKSA